MNHILFIVYCLSKLFYLIALYLFDSDNLWNGHNLPFTNMVNSVLTPLSTLMIMLKGTSSVLRGTQWNVFLAGQWSINNTPFSQTIFNIDGTMCG